MQYVIRIVGGLLAVLWAFGTLGGYGCSGARRNDRDVPASVRQSPGGYRSWSFWHAGSHGGK